MLFLSTDIDGTIYDGQKTARVFSDFWLALQETTQPPPLLAYNTGRSLEDVQDLIQDSPLPQPDWIICAVGTVIYHPDRETQHQGWHDRLSEGWDFNVVETLVAAHTPARAQPPECQGPHKCSWYWEGASSEHLSELESRIQEAGVEAQAVYSSNRDLDVLPRRADKGQALRFLLEELAFPLSKVVVSGDSGNDLSMFLIEDVHGIVVANAEATLWRATEARGPYRAQNECVYGVIEGIEHLRQHDRI